MLHRQFLFGANAKINPVPVPPPFTYTKTGDFTSTQTTIFDYYGRCVALNGDGTILVVGSDENSLAETAGPGRVYVYIKSGTSWSSTPSAVLTAADGAINNSFGESVDISDDGNTIVVGAPGATVGSNINQGAAYVFSRQNPTSTVWTQTKKLIASDGEQEDTFGYKVAISSTGTTIAVSAIRGDYIPTYSVGSVYVFNITTTWTQTNKLVASDYKPDDGFGCSISMSDNAETIVIGSSGADVGVYNNSGAAYCFTRLLTGTAILYQQTSKVSSSLPVVNQSFGYSVSITPDGTGLVVGAPAVGNGCVYVFTKSGTGWSQRHQLFAADGQSGDYFGSSVAISSSIQFFAVGAILVDDASLSQCGAVYLYTNLGLGWVQTGKMLGSMASGGDQLGYSVAITPDALTVAAGAPTRSESTLPTPIPGAPVADFIATPRNGSSPLTVSFTDTSTNSPTSWAWDFENSGIINSTLQNPAWTYTDIGLHSVKLTVTNGSGSNTVIKSSYIAIDVPLPPNPTPPVPTSTTVIRGAAYVFSRIV